MQQRKAIFLDVDGTLVSEEGVVPESAENAIREARARGHLVFLCTGRSAAELWPELLELGFDGAVTGAGAYVVAGDEVLAHHTLTDDDIQAVMDYFDARGGHYFFQAHDGVFGSRELQQRLRDIIDAHVEGSDLETMREGLFSFVDSIEVDADPFARRITKVMFVDADTSVEEVQEAFVGRFDVIPSSVPIFGSRSGEIQLRGIHKATGIQVMTAHLGLDRADTMALGDSYNDLEMLEHVAIGIAMGNAPQPVRDVADEMTSTPEEHGVREAFLRHGLIEG